MVDGVFSSIDDNDIVDLKNAASAINSLNAATVGAQTTANQYNKDLNEFLDLTKKLNTALSEEVSELKNIIGSYEEYYSLKKKLSDATEEQSKAENNYNKVIGSLSSSQSEVKKIIEEGLIARRKLTEYSNLAKNSQDAYNNSVSQFGASSVEAQNALKKSVIDAQNLAKFQDQATKLAELGKENYASLGLSIAQGEESLIQQAIIQGLLNQQAKEAERNAQRRLNYVQQELDQENKIMATIKKIGSYASHFVDTLKDSKIFSSLTTQLTAFGFSFNAIFSSLMEYDKIITNTSKELGISKDGTRALARNLESASVYAHDINKNAIGTVASIKNQLAAQQEINDALGTSSLLDDKARIDQVVLTKQMGLQAGEAANLYKLGKLNNTTAMKATEAVFDQVIGARQTLGIQLDHKKVLQDVVKVSGQLAVQYQNNPELIAKAVVQTKALGLELQQTSKMADSLLNFENSISNELKAELLTGKALNLEKARELALRGDSAAAAKELMDNVGGLSEFQELNVLQQRSLADAIGLGVDELSNALVQQKMLEGTAFTTTKQFEEAAKQAALRGESEEFIAGLKQSANSEELIAQATQISNQEKFNSTVEKLKETLSAILDGPFGNLLDGFANLLSKAWALKTVLTIIGTILTVQIAAGFASAIKDVVKLIAKLAVSAGLAVTTNSFMTFGAGVAVALAAASGVYAMVSSLSGENINVTSAGGGGVNTDNIVRPNQYQLTNSQASNQSDRPVNLNVNVGGKNVATVNDALRSNSSYAV
jgi:hypothetical protein